MKMSNKSLFKRLTAIIMSMCIMLSLTFAVSAADPATVAVINIDNGAVYIDETGYTVGDAEKVDFVGEYILYGTKTGGIHFSSGTYNVTVHNMDAYAEKWCSALTMDSTEKTVINLTVKGINRFEGYNHSGITGNSQAGHVVNISLAENSSIKFSASYAGVVEKSVLPGINIQMADGTAVPGTDVTDWRKSPLEIKNGTPEKHAMGNIEYGEGHAFGCIECGFVTGTVSAHDFSKYQSDENGHVMVCSVCGAKEGEAVAHTPQFRSTDLTHRTVCEICGYETLAPEEHKYEAVKDNFLSDAEHQIKCSVCEWTSSASHTFLYKSVENGHVSVCSECLYENGTVQPHENIVTISSPEGHKYKCKHCGESSGEAFIPHNPVYGYSNIDHYLVCDDCEYKLNEGEAHTLEYTLDEINPDNYHFMSCAVCGYQGASMHTLAYYEAEGGGHIRGCKYCSYREEEVCKHVGEKFYYYFDETGCAEYCDDCGYEFGEIEPHNMEDYYYADPETCVHSCSRCGYYDFEEPLDHVFTQYVSAGEDGCMPVCENCGGPDYIGGTVLHSMDTGVPVEAIEKEPEHMRYTCMNCGYIHKEYAEGKALIIKVGSEYGDAWETDGLLLYINGEPTEFIRYMAATYSYSETYVIPYDENSSYVFKWILSDDYSAYYGDPIRYAEVGISGQTPVDISLTDAVEVFETVYAINMADYTDVNAALATVPQSFEKYTPESVEALVKAVRGVKRMLPAVKQEEVDAMAAAVETAVDGLELNPDGEEIAHGVINLSYYGAEIYAGFYEDDDYFGYYLVDENYNYYWYEYDGDYVFIDTNPKDSAGEKFATNYVELYSGEVDAEFINVYFVSDSMSGLNLYSYETDDHAGMNAVFTGPNAMISSAYSGIHVSENSSLTIDASNGSLVAIGADDCAGIGGDDYYDEYDEISYINCGDVTIDSGIVYAMSMGDGAGIGGAYGGNFGTITINGGRVYAECLSDDGSGIGVGEDGVGGDIIINGGDITALSLGDDGAGIGGADEGYVDSITITGGNIVAGSDDAAAIGGGQDEVSRGGKITISGGSISAHPLHDPDESLIGNGSSSSEGESENNYVIITGGEINFEGSDGIDPAPVNGDGEKLAYKEYSVHESYNGKEVILVFSDGTEKTVTVKNGRAGALVLESAELTNLAELQRKPGIYASVVIKNNNGERTINYGETLELTAEAVNIPDGAKIYWYVNNEQKGEGEKFRVSPTDGSVEVSVKIVDADGNPIQNADGSESADSQKISVNSSFWQKIISFFKNLFRINRTVVQVIKKAVI